ncbi:HutD family protein [Streptomyces sp. SID5785]|uniref:HutD/Ves family protein n=1 Tax=Streptomyces sp. SID5785 TaxID=2690309 RepID=UPI001361B3F4|nr:HutD family protein [Streptomyces sp. SID5785]MZD04034.1 HutD family protein [Streptomyces sp. SID5785]
MAHPRILRAHERTPSPWKNGGGITTEVLAHPEGSGTSDFAWRISLADVADSGPFSAFEGVDRVITVVDGPGMALTVDGMEHVVDTRYAPFAFSGDATTDCRLLGGPLVDFNVMARRSAARAEVRIERGPTVLAPRPGTQVLAIVLDGTAELDGDGDGDGVRLDRLDACLLQDDAAPAALAVDGVVAVVSLTEAGAG